MKHDFDTLVVGISSSPPVGLYKDV